MELDTRQEAKEYIENFKLQLEEKGLLENVDELALILIETTFSTWLDATEFILENGTTFEVVSREGSTTYRPYPEVKIQLDSRNSLTKLLKEFGGTSLARKNVKAEKVEEDDALTEFLKGKGKVEKRKE